MNNSFLSLHKKAILSSIKFGKENQPLLKVDSYMQDPKILIDYAINKNTFVSADNFYPGIRMPVPLSYLKALVYNLGPSIEATFGVNLRKIKNATASFSIITTSIDKLGFFHTIPHFDGLGENKLALLHYLCEMPDTGTCFYHHKELGYDFIDDERADRYEEYIKHQFRNKSNVYDSYIYEDSDEFQKIASFECVFNRLLIYKASSLHSGHITPDYNFDSNPRTGRLTIASFIEFN